MDLVETYRSRTATHYVARGSGNNRLMRVQDDGAVSTWTRDGWSFIVTVPEDTDRNDAALTGLHVLGY